MSIPYDPTPLERGQEDVSVNNHIEVSFHPSLFAHLESFQEDASSIKLVESNLYHILF